MGRKKEIVQETNLQIEESVRGGLEKEPQVEVPKSPNQSSSTNIGYAGKVSVTVRHGNRVIRKYTGKNLGSLLLFRYISQALAGDFQAQNRPFGLRLVSYKLNDLPTTWKDLDVNWTTENVSIASQKVAINTTPVVTSTVVDENTGDISCSVTFSWLVPYGALLVDTGDSINQLYLLDRTHDLVLDGSARPSQSALAEFNLKQDDWITVESGDEAKGFNLIIDWTLTIGNVKQSVEEET